MILAVKTKSKKRTLTKKTKTKLDNSDLKLLHSAANAAYEKKGENILLLDVSKLTVISDYFLIISAKSSAQIEAIERNIKDELSKLNHPLISKEGLLGSSWTILDFGNIVVHIMGEKERDYYKLERFWSNATIIENKIWEKVS